jgi:Rrf2 family protein
MRSAHLNDHLALDREFFRNYICYMKRRSRMSTVLHLLVHLVQANRVPVTSQQLAACHPTNPVVIRRDLAALRQAGVVHSTTGHGGGWTLARDPAQITVAEVYSALGEHVIALPAPGAGSQGCLLEARVHQALGGVHEELEALLRERLGRLTLADLVLELPKHGFLPSQHDSPEVRHGV